MPPLNQSVICFASEEQSLFIRNAAWHLFIKHNVLTQHMASRDLTDYQIPVTHSGHGIYHKRQYVTINYRKSHDRLVISSFL